MVMLQRCFYLLTGFSEGWLGTVDETCGQKHKAGADAVKITWDCTVLVDKDAVCDRVREICNVVCVWLSFSQSPRARDLLYLNGWFWKGDFLCTYLGLLCSCGMLQWIRATAGRRRADRQLLRSSAVSNTTKYHLVKWLYGGTCMKICTGWLLST